ncbi:MAG TPA: hypothetical protein H9681_06275 [Firmicutes bacterium]|nr:hypothetical protein [Bacillota bacterium]
MSDRALRLVAEFGEPLGDSLRESAMPRAARGRSRLGQRPTVGVFLKRAQCGDSL